MLKNSFILLVSLLFTVQISAQELISYKKESSKLKMLEGIC